MSDPMAERRAFLANVTEFEAAVRAQAIERPGQVWTRDYRPCDQRVDAARKRLIAHLDALSRVVAAAERCMVEEQAWTHSDAWDVAYGELRAAVAAYRDARDGGGE